MEFAFYFASGIAVVSTLRVITNTNPVHALLYLIISLIAVARSQPRRIGDGTGAPYGGEMDAAGRVWQAGRLGEGRTSWTG